MLLIDLKTIGPIHRAVKVRYFLNSCYAQYESKVQCRSICLLISPIFFFSGEDARHSKLLDKFDHGPIGSIRRLPLAVSCIC